MPTREKATVHAKDLKKLAKEIENRSVVLETLAEALKMKKRAIDVTGLPTFERSVLAIDKFIATCMREIRGS